MSAGAGGKAEQELVFRQTCPKNNSWPPRLEDPPDVRGQTYFRSYGISEAFFR